MRRRREKGSEVEGANALALLVDAAADDANMGYILRARAFFFVVLGESGGFSGYTNTLNVKHLHKGMWDSFPRARERERCHSQRQRTIRISIEVRPKSFLSLSFFVIQF